MAHSSNCPVSRPAITNYESHADLGGLAWNDEKGLFFPVDDEELPIKAPHFLSYRPTVR